MAQRNIDFGTFPDDPQADAIRTAFQKVQENFTEVYAGVEGASVASVNRTPGAGITVSSPTGNVIVTANIACVQVHTSTLSIGRDSNGAQDTSITASSQTLWVDLPANIANVSNINLSGYATANGNVTGGNINTAGQVVATGNVSGGNLNTGGQLVATGNITGGNLITTGTFSVTGNANVGNLGTSGLIVATGNVTGGNLVTGGALSVTGNANVGNLGTSGLVTATGNVTGGNITTAGRVVATGNVTGGNITTAGALISSVATGTAPLTVTSTTRVSNLNVAYANVADYINVTAPGTGTAYIIGANATTGNIAEYTSSGISMNLSNNAITATTFIGALSGAATSATTAGTVTTNDQPNITSVGTLSSLTVTGNITTSANVTGTHYGAATGLTNIPGANVTGTVPSATSATSATTAGTVTTAAQPNITSVGTLAGLTATGTVNTSGASNVTLGPIGNIHITGGSSGYTIKTDGAGNLSWGVDTAAAGGANTYVQFNDSDTLNGSANYTFDKTTSKLTLNGNIQTSNADLGNSAVANYFTGNFYGRANTANTVLIAAQPNITSLGTLTSLTVSGGIANLGAVANVKILGGSGFLYNDSSNNLTYQSVVTQTIPGDANALLYSTGSNNIAASANIKFNDPNLDVTGNITASGTVTGALLTGTLTTAAQPNITSVGTLNGLTVSSAGLIVSGAGNINAGNMIVTGVFSGNGSSLSSIVGANVTGAVSYATTANSVAGANVSGAVSYATTANSVAGANVSGTVANATYAVSAGSATTATTAGTVTTAAQPNITSVGTLSSLSVTGKVTAGQLQGDGGNISNIQGANVSGAVSLATYATTANAVAGANVSGAVSYATTANAVAGANVSGAVSYATTANSVAGANVSGAVALASSATTAGTVTTAAQPNITSTGTLTSVTSIGNISGTNLIASGYQFRSVATGITAAGTTQGAATAITKGMNIVSTVSSGANGVVLPTAVAGMVLTITNTNANVLNVFPASGAAINTLGANASFSQGTTTIQFIAPTSTQWYTVGATYA